MTQSRVSIIPEAAGVDPRLTALDVRILVILGRVQTNGGYVAPKRAEIALFAQCCESSVPRSIRKLAEFGYVERGAQFTDTGKQLTNVYRVKLDQPAAGVSTMIPVSGMTPVSDMLPVAPKTPSSVVVAKSDTPKDLGRGIPGDRGIKAPIIEDISLLSKVSSKPSDTELVSSKDNTLSSTKRRAPSKPRLSQPSDKFMGLWALWGEGDLIRRSRRKASWEAYERMIRAGAHAAEIEAGMRAYLADPEKTKDRGQFMPAFERWLGDETWREWAEQNGGPKVDWSLRLGFWLDKKLWPERWGPSPDDPACEAPKDLLAEMNRGAVATLL